MPAATFQWLASILVAIAAAIAASDAARHYELIFGFVERDLSDKLRRLRTRTPNLRAWLVAWLLAMAATFIGVWVGLGSLIFAALATGFLVAAPWWIIRRMAERRRQRIEDQLADSMVTLSNAVKAGLSLPQSLELMAAQCPPPISTEFHQISAEYKLGKPLERTLNEAKSRLRSENFALFAAALLASHESGGRLNETVERIAHSVLELQRLDRKVKSETAQARKSAIYMALAPAFILTAYYFVDPINTRLLFVSPIGQLLLATAVVLDVIAYFWARAILRPDL